MRQGFFTSSPPNIPIPPIACLAGLGSQPPPQEGRGIPPILPQGWDPPPPSSIAIPIRDPCKREEEEILLLLLFEACTTNVHT